MRRTLAFGLLSIALATTALPAGAHETAPVAEPAAPTTQVEAPAEVPVEVPVEDPAAAAEAALADVDAVLEDDPDAVAPDLTLALGNLVGQVEHLSGAQRERAEELLSPGDLTETPGNARAARAEAPICDANLCVHYTTDPASPHRTSAAWANQVFAVMQQVWAQQVGELGYRPPRSDGGSRGTAQFDVVILDTKSDPAIGGIGVYGFCRPLVATYKNRTTAAECAIENDFAEPVFQRQTPLNNLRVTAAHEFFHAIQFAHDVLEDGWMKEASATWIEERYATDVNDNRQFFASNALSHPKRPLDHKLSVYGNWVWFEYLSTRFGNGIVRKIWQRSKSRKNFSIRSFHKVLKGKRGGFARNFARFANVNTNPAIFYPEGAAWPPAKIQASKQVRKGKKKKRTTRFKAGVKQLGAYSADIRVNPAGMAKNKKKNRKRKLIVRVSGPRKVKSPAAHALIYRTNGTIKQKAIKLNKRGNGRLKVKVGRGKVAKVTVTVVNASHRFKRCRYNGGANDPNPRACAGKPRDRKVKFVIRGILQK